MPACIAEGSLKPCRVSRTDAGARSCRKRAFTRAPLGYDRSFGQTRQRGGVGPSISCACVGSGARCRPVRCLWSAALQPPDLTSLLLTVAAGMLTAAAKSLIVMSDSRSPNSTKNRPGAAYFCPIGYGGATAGFHPASAPHPNGVSSLPSATPAQPETEPY